MVQIPEYTRRENAQPMQRGGISINVPDALTRPQPDAVSSGVKNIMKLGKDLADVFVNMKERRDDGIVSAFMNQYDKESTKKMIELRDQYRGSEAYRVMPEFQKWRDAYIAEHSYYDPDNAKEGVVYIENKAQQRIASQKLDSYNVRDINSISAYIGEEEEKFRVNNLNALISTQSEKLVNENFSQSAAILKAAIAGNVASLYRGQSRAFLKNVTDELLDKALYGNVMRDSATNPIASIGRFQDKVFSKEMKSATRETARDNLTKAFINYQANQVARAQTGKFSSPAGDEFYKANADFFKGNLDSIKSQVEDKAIEIRNNLLEDDHRNNTAALNDLTVQILHDREMIGNSANPQDKQKYLEQQAIALSALTGVRGGVETAKMIDNVFTEVNDFDWLLRVEDAYKKGHTGLLMLDGKLAPSEAEAKRRMDEYRQKAVKGSETNKQVLTNINLGKYETLLDIPNFDDYSPHQKKQIMTAFANKARYESLVKTAKDKSNIDFDYQIDKIYKYEHGETWKNPVMYNQFKLDMAKQINKWLSVNPNKIPEAKDLQVMANASIQTQKDETMEDTIISIQRDVDFDDRNRDYSTVKQELVNAIKSKGRGWFSNWYYTDAEEAAIDRAADFILDGDRASGVDLLREAKIFD